jgi:type II secretory ATPase GspE/PulE/Tfp pilus assembly ATPase PilB-like protein
MISSLADKKTTGLAIQAATSGHLVIAGMHGENALAALAHLRAASEEPFLFTHAMRLMVSQRLVRKLCVRCRISYKPAKEELAEIEKAFGIATAANRQRLHQLERAAMDSGIGGHVGLHTGPSGLTSR